MQYKKMRVILEKIVVFSIFRDAEADEILFIARSITYNMAHAHGKVFQYNRSLVMMLLWSSFKLASNGFLS